MNPSSATRIKAEPFTQIIKPFARDYHRPLLLVLALRIGMSTWLALVWTLTRRFLPVTKTVLLETYGKLTPQPGWAGQALLDVWLRWDAVHYMNIARVGYGGVGTGDFNFAPLYPMLVLWLKPVFFGSEVFTGLTVSTICVLLAFLLFYRLIIDEFADEGLATDSVVLLAVYPTCFFLFAPFTDSLFLCLVMAYFLALQRRWWLAAGLLAILATLARLQGVLLVLPMCISMVQQDALNWRKIEWKAVSGLALAPLGYLLYTGWRSSLNLGNAAAGLAEYSKIIFIDPVSGIFLAVRQALDTGSLLVITELLSVLLFGSILIWMALQPAFRKHLPLLAYAAAMLLLFLSKHSTAASSLQSANRYVLAIFPAFIGAAALLRPAPTWLRKTVISVSLSLLMIASALYALWFFVG